MIYLHIWFLLYCVHSSRLFSDFFQSYILAKMNRMMPPQNMSGLVLPIYLESKIPHGPKVVVTLLLILCIQTLALTLNHFYRPQTKFAKVIFLHVSVILFTEGRSPGPHQGGVQVQARAGFIPACTEADTTPQADGYCCGRYASDWNAFFSEINFVFVVLL